MMNVANHRWLLIALLFIFFTSLFLSSAVTDPRDVFALRSLYGALRAPPQLAGWRLDNGDPCGVETWQGVTCTGPSVVSVNIRGLGVGGYLGLELSAFRSLNELDVSHNGIGGEIPVPLPPNVTRINLSANRFTGSIPYSLPSLKYLSHLNVSHNQLSGVVGNVFTDMETLEELDLSFNHFKGDLPLSFTSLTNLHGLYLQDNEFTGSVNYLANLPLSFLYLQNNHFSGYVPKQFEFMPDVRIYGNLFPFGDASPPSINNEPTQPPLSFSAPNISPSPEVILSPFSSPDGHNHTHRTLSMGAIFGIVSSLLLVVVLVAAVITRILRSWKSDVDVSNKRDESSSALQISIPSVRAVDPGSCSWRSAVTSVRPSVVRRAKLEMMPRRRGSSRRPEGLPPAKLYSVSDILAATNNYSEENLLGEGPIGFVYRAKFPGCKMCSIKKISKIKLADNEEEFLDVINELFDIRHPNIVSLKGCCLDLLGGHVLVYDYAGNGSLYDFLHSDTHIVLPWKARVMIALGVAHALRHMHSTCCPPIPHGNVKTTNILLDDKLIPHISDSGLILLKHLISTKPKASDLPTSSIGYAAPEKSTSGINEIQSDIYSFGVVLLQLLTGRRAFDNSRSREEQFLVTWASSRLYDLSLLEEMVDPEIKGSIPPRVLSQFADTVVTCIQPEPEFRQTMAVITDKLACIAEEMGDHQKMCLTEASISTLCWT